MRINDTYNIKLFHKRNWMSVSELEAFDRHREIGLITVFRVGNCKVCNREILKGKIYCSRKCKEDLQQRREKAMSEWVWEIELESLFGLPVIIETLDGIYLQGELTGVEYGKFEFLDEEVRYPTAFILDDDPEKKADVQRLVKIEMAGDDDDEG